MASDDTWTITRWNDELCEMVNRLTFFHPLPIQCSQCILIESFQNKDYCPLLYSLEKIHYKHLDLNALIHRYHEIITNSNHKNEYYPFKRLNFMDSINNITKSMLFHPLVAIYDFSSSFSSFINIIAMKNEAILSEFVMANFIFQSNAYLLRLMFDRLSYLEINSSHSIYNKVKAHDFMSHYQQSDVLECMRTLRMHISKRIMSDSCHLIDELLSSRDLTAANSRTHLIECVLDYNPWFVFQRLSVLSSANYHHIQHLLTLDNDILFILSAAILTIQSAPHDVLSAHTIAIFIDKTYNSWNKTLSFMQSKSNNHQEIYECHSLIIKALTMHLESSEYLSMFNKLQPSMERINRDHKKYCTLIVAQLWIETTSSQLYELWKMVMEQTIKRQPKDVLNDVKSTQSLIQQIMQTITSIIPSADHIQAQDINPLKLSQYPFAAFCDIFLFVIQLLQLSMNEYNEHNVYLSMMQTEAYISMCFDWFNVVNQCLIHHFTNSHYLTQLLDEFVFEILSLFKTLSLENKELFNRVATNAFRSWNDLYTNISTSSESVMDIFSCACKGIKACGCTRDISSRHHSLNVILWFITRHSSLRQQVFADDELLRDAIFPFMQRLIFMCCDIPSLILVLEFCSKYIHTKMHQINDQNILSINSKEHESLLELAQTTKRLFAQFFYNHSVNMKRYVVCDKIFKLWGSYLSINDVYSFTVLIRIQCHVCALEALSIFNIKNAPVLFNLLMEKTKELKMQQNNANDGFIGDILRDTAQNKFCKILMDLYAQWMDDNEELSANRISLIIEGLKHLIEMNHSTLNTQLFGLLSYEDSNYPLFLYSICKLKWSSEHFETEDIKHLLIILDLAHKNSKWTRTMNQLKEKKRSNKKLISHLFKTLFDIINNESDDNEKREAAIIFTKVKQKMMRYL